MAGILDGVDQRTQLVGENRLELLLFRLKGPQMYGINVFKVQEVIRCPELTHIPNSNSVVKGIANMRGRTIPVLDLSLALKGAETPATEEAFVIIADYNRTTQGFLVDSVERIVNMNWEEILAPPKGSGANSYMTAVTRVDEKLVEIIDVEKVLSEVVGVTEKISDKIIDENHIKAGANILVADDSNVARKQIKRTLDQLGIESTLVKDGQEALDTLLDWADDDPDIAKHLTMVISDVEMPNMDGYTLTTEIRREPRLKDLFVILHTSLSGVFNQSMVEKVGANKFIAKFDADELASAVLEAINKQDELQS
ncbi:MAG: chemotaxis protein CheV [Gammaproteobacteria bacterium]|nr:chemotaxis protein CheV [Gammaproteobacteria bacterium]MCF6261711.1 chemotaxis protein CheV [Gammaproteobacteria bacterium]